MQVLEIWQNSQRYNMDEAKAIKSRRRLHTLHKAQESMLTQHRWCHRYLEQTIVVPNSSGCLYQSLVLVDLKQMLVAGLLYYFFCYWEIRKWLVYSKFSIYCKKCIIFNLKHILNCYRKKQKYNIERKINIILGMKRFSKCIS